MELIVHILVAPYFKDHYVPGIVYFVRRITPKNCRFAYIRALKRRTKKSRNSTIRITVRTSTENRHINKIRVEQLTEIKPRSESSMLIVFPTEWLERIKLKSVAQEGEVDRLGSTNVVCTGQRLSATLLVQLLRTRRRFETGRPPDNTQGGMC